MRYFDHDTTATKDDKVVALRMEHGGEAVFCYWAILEKIYADEAPVRIDETDAETKALTVWLGFGFEVLKKYVSSMVAVGLFETVENDVFTVTSERAMENIAAYRGKCETARRNGKKGGRKPRQKPNANQSANQPQSDCQAKKRKEKKSMGFDEQNPILTARDAAGGESPATPRATMSQDEVKAVFDSVDKVDRGMMAARAQSEQWEADATTCPTEVLEAVRGCA